MRRTTRRSAAARQVRRVTASISIVDPFTCSSTGSSSTGGVSVGEWNSRGRAMSGPSAVAPRMTGEESGRPGSCTHGDSREVFLQPDVSHRESFHDEPCTDEGEDKPIVIRATQYHRAFGQDGRGQARRVPAGRIEESCAKTSAAVCAAIRARAPDAVPVVLVHDIASDAGVWGEFVADLRAWGRCALPPIMPGARAGHAGCRGVIHGSDLPRSPRARTIHRRRALHRYRLGDATSSLSPRPEADAEQQWSHCRDTIQRLRRTLRAARTTRSHGLAHSTRSGAAACRLDNRGRGQAK